MGAEKRKESKLHNNGGYSLIELVIVLAIIAVLMSGVFYSIILIFSANAKSCANDIQRSIGDCKVTTMGRAAAYMELYRDVGNENVYTRMYVKDKSGAYVPSEAQKVGTRRVYVAYLPEGGVETELTPGSSIQICFDRASGGFQEDAGGTFYSMIRVQGGSKNYEITMTKLTGKSEVKAVP